jgi:hypothetical protein
MAATMAPSMSSGKSYESSPDSVMTDALAPEKFDLPPAQHAHFKHAPPSWGQPPAQQEEAMQNWRALFSDSPVRQETCRATRGVSLKQLVAGVLLAVGLFELVSALGGLFAAAIEENKLELTQLSNRFEQLQSCVWGSPAAPGELLGAVHGHL